MPGPGNQGRSRKHAKKPTTTSRSIPEAEDALVREFQEILGWKDKIDRVCQFLRLPNLDTRNGLKRIHANFNDIHSRMEELYRASENHIMIQGAIVGILSRMSVDSILRNKLFEKDILNKIMPLLHGEETRHLALLSLNIITHHDGSKAGVEITSDLIKLIRDLPDDKIVVQVGVSIITRLITIACGDTKLSTYPQALASIDLVEVLKTIMEVVKKPHPDYGSIVENAIDLLSALSLQNSAAFQAYPTAISFLAAGMRSKDWSYRCICLRNLIRLNCIDEDDLPPSFSVLHEAIDKIIDSKMPPHLLDIIDEYGSMKSHFLTYAFCSSESAEAIVAYTRNHDLYALGLKLASLIVQTRYSITHSNFVHPEAGDVNSPFPWWIETLPLSAKVIREKGKPDERDEADILDINYLVIKERGPEALAMARRGIERNPEQGYFYYVLSVSESGAQGLRLAKKGMKCRILAPHLKYLLLERAIEYAAALGLLQVVKNTDDPSWKEGVAFFMSAIEDAKAYIEGAPPDEPYMRNACSLYVLLKILAEPDISPDLSEFDDTLKKLSIATQFCDFCGFAPSKNATILTQQLVLKYYPLGVKEFSSVFKNFDEAKSNTRAVDREKAADDLADWLEGVDLEDSRRPIPQKHDPIPESAANDETVIMYRCSWCHNTSALLRKCRGCVQSRYCDTSCQKAHWQQHKKVCEKQS